MNATLKMSPRRRARAMAWSKMEIVSSSNPDRGSTFSA
jgi:hypothetical protein